MARFWRAFFVGKVRLMANSMDFSLVLRAKTEQFKQEMAQARIQLKQLVQALEELNLS